MFTFAPHRILISRWKRPLLDGEGLPEEEIVAAEERLGVVLPAALREWYRIAGRRPDLTATQNFLQMPGELELNEGGLVIYVENQSTCQWFLRYTDLGQNDPPVYRVGEGGDRAESPTLTEFLRLMLIQEIVVTADWSGFGALTEPADAALNRLAVNSVGGTPWSWPQDPTRFYEGEKLLVMTNGGEWLWFAAGDEETQTTLLKDLRGYVTWENINRGDG